MASDTQPFSTILTTASPKPLSINAIIRKHDRERLYVHPLQWVQQHLTLLGCQFHHGRKLEAGSGQQHQAKVLEHEVISAATALLRPCTAESKGSTVETLFKVHGIHRVGLAHPGVSADFC